MKSRGASSSGESPDYSCVRLPRPLAKQLGAASVQTLELEGKQLALPESQLRRWHGTKAILSRALAARELGRLNLADALELAALIAGNDPQRYGRAAVRWHGR